MSFPLNLCVAMAFTQVSSGDLEMRAVESAQHIFSMNPAEDKLWLKFVTSSKTERIVGELKLRVDDARRRAAAEWVSIQVA